MDEKALDKIQKERNEISREQNIKNLRGWILPKEVVIRGLYKTMEAQELYIKNLNEDLESGFFIKQKRKEIKEQITDGSKKLKELELEMLKLELDFGFLPKQANIIMEDLKEKIKLEENALIDIKKKIIKAERNHKIELTEENAKQEDNEPKTIPEGMTKEEAGKSKEIYLEPDNISEEDLK